MIGTALTPEVQKMNNEIKGYSQDYGLDFFETIFELIEYKQINEIAAFGGFPTRYPHWRFGMEYDRLSKSYRFGLHKIYEMVINNDPCYAYLLRSNSPVDNKLVMAHVYAHCDFFKCNMFFDGTNRKMMDEMANHATRVRNYIDRYGVGIVEDFIDMCLSIENLIDYHATKVKNFYKPEVVEDTHRRVHKLKSKNYMDKFINPKEFIKEQTEKIAREEEKTKKIPPSPVRDVLLFLQELAPLESWQRDILSIIREEAYYFAPQGQTKIINEGWASYWHSKIMTERALKDSEIIDFADHHSSTVFMKDGTLNPYKLGLELLKDIEERWGRDKIFEVRRLYNDVTFIDTFLTPEFAEKFKLFTFDVSKRTWQWEISSREFQKVKNKLLFSLTNFGQPLIFVEDANFRNRSELLLVHKHEGIDLKISEAKNALENVQRIWKRTVNLKTVVQSEGKILTYDGNVHSEEKID